MRGAVADLLASRGDFAPRAERVPIARALAIAVLAGALYGTALGSLGLRPLAVLYAACKVPLLLVVTTAVCLPSYRFLLGVLGLGRDFSAALRAIVCAQAAAALALGSLAPVTAFFHASGVSYPAALLLATGAFAAAAVAGQAVLVRHLRPLVARDRRHARALLAWFGLHAFVAVKLAWVLRPFVGDPALPVAFLREQRWHENPYASLFWGAVGLAHAVVGRLLAG